MTQVTQLRGNLQEEGKVQGLTWVAPTHEKWAKGEELSCELEDKPGRQGESQESFVLLNKGRRMLEGGDGHHCQILLRSQLRQSLRSAPGIYQQGGVLGKSI